MARLTFLISVITISLCGVLLAAEGHSQSLETARVELSAGKTSVAALLSRIQSQTGFTFAYPEAIGQQQITASTNNRTSLSVLFKMLEKQYRLRFTQLDNLIAISQLQVPVKPGKISGKVLDEKGIALPGAGIEVVETSQSVRSNVDGTYQLNLAPGTYTLEVSYVSYQRKRVTGIVVTEGKNTPLDIAMLPGNNVLNAVTITADYKKSSVEGLYAKQKNNTAITDGISAEQIARTPDKNIGETLKRVSGVSVLENKYVVVRGLGERYNGTMMNGQVMPSTELNRKQFSFDIIPSNMVDNVTIYKTITPDKSAEFGGGLVEVNTKSIPTENFLGISIGESYNDKTTAKDFKGLNINSRSYFGLAPADRTLLGRTDWKNLDDIRTAYTVQGSSAGLFANNWKLYTYRPLPSPNLQASFGRVINLKNNDQIGIIASASYRNTWQTSDVIMSRYGYLGTDGDKPERYGFTGKRYGFTSNLGGIAGIGYTGGTFKLSLQSTYLRTYDQQLLLGMGDQNDFPRAVGYYDQATQTGLLQNQLRGEKGFGKKGIKLDWLLSYTSLDRQKPDNHQFDANYIGSNTDGPEVPNSDFSIFNPRNRVGGIAQRNWSRSHENNLSWNLDLTVPVKADILEVPLNTSFKTGYAGWQKDRLFWVANTNSVGFAGSEPQPLSETFDPVLHPGGAINILSFGDQYKNKANLNAGYVMLDSKIGTKFRLTGGLRGEYYDLNRINTLLQRFVERQTSQNNDLTDYTDVLRQEQKFNLFPSAGLVYSLTPKMNLRLSYAKSIIRPDLRELAYFNEFDYELGGIYQSNTPIRSTKIDNFDFRYEWYPHAGEILSFSLFYKKLKYPMEIYQAETSSTYELRNDHSAKNKGIELEARKSFAFTELPVLRNLTIYGNFTRLFAKVTPMTVIYRNSDPEHPNRIIVTDNPGPEVERPQAGASNYTYNAGVYYDDKALSLSLSYNYITNRVFRASTVYQNSLFEMPLPSLDGQATVNLLKRKAQVKLNVSNLLNRAGRIYSKREGFLSKTLLYEKPDFIDYQGNPGRTYGLSFNYNF